MTAWERILQQKEEAKAGRASCGALFWKKLKAMYCDLLDDSEVLSIVRFGEALPEKPLQAFVAMQESPPSRDPCTSWVMSASSLSEVEAVIAAHCL
eukprot:6483834-Amphidinium_carterae.1